MKLIKHFFQGATLRHVDYATRHHSRSYEIGTKVGMTILFVIIPIAAILSAGVLIGAIIWRG